MANQQDCGITDGEQGFSQTGVHVFLSHKISLGPNFIGQGVTVNVITIWRDSDLGWWVPYWGEYGAPDDNFLAETLGELQDYGITWPLTIEVPKSCFKPSIWFSLWHGNIEHLLQKIELELSTVLPAMQG